MADTDNGRTEAAGDAAPSWQVLDRVLPALCKVRDDLEEAGLEGLAEGLQGLIEEAEVGCEGAEMELPSVTRLFA